MNNKIGISIFARAKESLVSLRKKYGIKNRYSMSEFARNAGLPVEYLENIPTTFQGFLDWNPDPSFIAVNRSLPAHDQVLFIARQVATCAQKRRCNSLALNRPWKWEMFDAAPAAPKQKISEMDIEYRAHFFMMFADVFQTLTTIKNDAVILVASIIALGVTVLAWQLGRAWIIKCTLDEEYEEFKEQEIDDRYVDMVQDDLF